MIISVKCVAITFVADFFHALDRFASRRVNAFGRCTTQNQSGFRTERIHWKIQDGEGRRNVIGLRVNENIIAAGQMQCEQAMVLRRLQSQRVAVELLLLRDVRRSKSTERFAVFQHDNPSPNVFVWRRGFGSQILFSDTADKRESTRYFKRSVRARRIASTAAKRACW
jgi:hypothetical protein